MPGLKEHILTILYDLGEDDFKQFKWHLKLPGLVEGLQPLKTSHLEKADRMETVDLIVQKYTTDATQIVGIVLKKIKRTDLQKKVLNRPKDSTSDVPETSESSASSSQRPNDALTGEEKARRERDDKLRGLLEKTSGYEEQLQSNMSSTYLSVSLGTMLKVVFENIFIWLYNVDIEDTDIHSHHEVRQMEMKKEGTLIQLIEMFKDRSGLIVRTVLTVGCAGIGKTFLVHKFLSDWARKCFPQDPHLVFPLKFRQLNLLKGPFRLAQLIHHCIKETRFMEEDFLNDIFNELQKSVDYNKSSFKVMFIMDGYDEKKFHFDFEADFGPMNLVDSYPVEHLLVNLIKGELLPSARIWITSRPAASIQIPKDFVNRMTEVRGFIEDDQKKEFFMKSIGDENKASSIFSHIKKSKILHTMCEIPVFCWFLARVVMSMKMKYKLPKTLVELFCHFLMGETLREKMKNTSQGKADKEKLIKDARDILLRLGKLAFHQLKKGQIIFYEEDLEACGLDVIKDMLISGFCTTFFKEDDTFFEQTVYCFVHLSLQEFLAAVYLFHCFTQKNTEVLKTFLEDDDDDSDRSLSDLVLKRQRLVLPPFLGRDQRGRDNFNSDGSLSDFLKAAMKKTMKSESGHLDLFVRFLHGLSLQSNQSLLGGLLGQTENSPEEIQRVIDNLKKMNHPKASPDRCINIFHCLMEMNDPSVSQGIQQYLESESSSGKKLTSTQCSALASMLLVLEEVLKELDLDKYNTDTAGRLRLIPAVRNCTTARLVGFGRKLEKEHIEVVASALSSNLSHLRHLDISYNHLEPNMDLLCDALRSPHCRLETLRLMNCWLSERSCELLASALRSNPHLRELDLTFNVLPVSALENFSGLETLKVKHGGELWTNPQLPTQYSHRLTLDPNTASRTVCLSDGNRKVTGSGRRQPYADHPDRFGDDGDKQVLCSEGLSGGRYLWEVETSGMVLIGGAYRAISRRGKGSWLGFNDHSWSLFCNGVSYSVRHNSRETFLPGVPSVSSRAVGETGQPVYRVAVYLDCPAGTLSFYEVSSDSLRHLYTYQTTFTAPLYPGFGFYTVSGSSVCLCEDRGREGERERDLS